MKEKETPGAQDWSVQKDWWQNNKNEESEELTPIFSKVLPWAISPGEGLYI